MTRKDYERIASAIKNAGPPAEHYDDVRLCIARAIAKELKADNGRFDEARFLAACGVEA